MKRLEINSTYAYNWRVSDMATIKYEENKQEQTRLAPTIQKSIDETIPEKYSTIASGATTIGIAERAPDESYH
jgi:hypothetical protein